MSKNWILIHFITSVSNTPVHYLIYVPFKCVCTTTTWQIRLFLFAFQCYFIFFSLILFKLNYFYFTMEILRHISLKTCGKVWRHQLHTNMLLIQSFSQIFQRRQKCIAFFRILVFSGKFVEIIISLIKWSYIFGDARPSHTVIIYSC